MQLSIWQRLLQTLGRVMLVTILTMGGVFIVFSQKDTHPSLGCVTLVTISMMGGVFVVFMQKDHHLGSQLMFDLAKKKMVVLGSGSQGCGRWHERTRACVGRRQQQR